MTFADSVAGQLERHAVCNPDGAAFTWLRDGEHDEVTLTWAALRRRVTIVAAHLQDRGMHQQRVLLLYRSGLEFVTALLGCLYGGAIPVPCPQARGARATQRLAGVVRDARPRLVLTETTTHAVAIDDVVRAHLAELNAGIITSDALDTAAGDRWSPPRMTDEDLALLQYTSGSTQTPRGVMISQANLLDNERRIRRAFQQDHESVILSWLPLHHDMGLIGTVLQPVFTGARTILMSPSRFIEQPVRWLRAIHRHGATTSGGPDFAYELCVRRVREDDAATLDLSRWRVAFNGAEPIAARTLESFARRFSRRGFQAKAFAPCYGLAEVTLFAAGGLPAGDAVVESFSRTELATRRAAAAPHDGTDARPLVACGEAGETIRIVNPETCLPCPDGQVGEIWIDSPSTGRGYAGQPDETARTFQARVPGSAKTFLRTGDLAFIHRRQLFVTGRLKDLIIIRGVNHDPQDVEASVLRHEGGRRLRAVAAIALQSGDRETLGILAEAAPGSPEDDRETMRQMRDAAAADHQVAPHLVVLVAPGSLLRTTSGKLRRHASRLAFEAGQLSVLARWTQDDNDDEIPERAGTGSADGSDGAAGLEVSNDSGELRDLVTRLLGVAGIASRMPLVRYGLDSLKATSLSYEIARRWDAAVDPVALLDGLSLSDLHERIRDVARHPAGEAPHAHAPGESEASPTSARLNAQSDAGRLSFGQEALWFRQRVTADDSSANIAVAAKIHGPFDRDRFARALAQVVRAHPILNARIFDDRGEPRQRCEADAPIRLTHRVVPAGTPLQEALTREAGVPFVLGEEPPLRVVLFDTPGESAHVLIVVHHIAIDIWSFAILLHALTSAYRRGDACEEDAVNTGASYRRFVDRQRAFVAGSDVEPLWRYWDRVLQDPPPRLLPSRAASVGPRWRASRIRSVIPPDVSRRLEALARDHDTTPFVVALGAYTAWLHRTFGRDDIIVGSPAHGRSEAGDAATIGYFANLLPLRCRLSAADSLLDVIALTRRTVLEALAHQALPFPLMVQRLAPARPALDTPWIETVFVWHDDPHSPSSALGAFAIGVEGARFALGEGTLESVPLERHATEFDVTVTIARHEDRFMVAVDTRDAAMPRPDAERHLASFIDDVRRMTLAPATPIGALGPPAPDASRTAGDGIRATAPPGARTGSGAGPCLHHRFEAQAAQHPESIAIRCGADTLTYAQVDARANQLARRIRRHEQRPEALVGIYLDRTADLAVAILAVLKANAAYLPLDVQGPPERAARLLAESGARVLVTSRQWRDRLQARICIDADGDDLASESDAPLHLPGSADQLAYCIYTSGSTGRPKGVLVAHRQVLSLFEATRDRFALGPGDVWTLFHSPAFDFSVWELWGALLHGAQLVVVPYAVSRDPRAFGALLAGERVTILSQTPAAFRMMMPELLAAAEPLALRWIVFGGEALVPSDLRPWASRFGVERPVLVNMYGITETTVHVTAHTLTAADIFADPASHIGHAIDGWQAHLLDNRLSLAAADATAEIHVGGAGVARGYLGDPALTATRFLPDPFSGTPGARMYRSGDLAMRVASGGVAYLGRADQQIKVRGFRIELGEIEAAIRQQPDVADAAVLFHAPSAEARGASGTSPLVVRRTREYFKQVAARDRHPSGLVAYVVPATAREFDGDALLDRLRRLLPDYMMPGRVVLVRALPLTANGKLDRAVLPLAAVASTGESDRPYAAPGDDVERLLAEVWAVVLDIPRVGIDDNYFVLGGDSMRALRVIALAEERGIRFDVARLFACQTIRALRTRCEVALAADSNDDHRSIAPRTAPFSLMHAEDRPLLPADAVDAYPLSRMQAGLIYHGADHPGTSVYRASFLYEFEGPCDAGALRRALQDVVDRHPILRTSFELAACREPVQIVHASRPAPLTSSDLRGRAPDERDREIEHWLEAERARDFALTVAPLFRAHVFRLDERRFALGLTCHDAVLDGWSTAGLLTEWLTGYDTALGEAVSHTTDTGGPTECPTGLPVVNSGPRVTYRDFVALERATLAASEHAAFWDGLLEGCAAPHVPGVFSTPIGPPSLRVLDVTVPPAVRDGLLAVARRAGVSLKHVLLAAHMRVLAVVTGVADVVTGLEANGRVESGDSGQVLGQHLNTLPFRLTMRGGTWLDLIRDTFERERAVLAHRRFPYAEIHRRQGRRALYDTTFNYTHFHLARGLGALQHVRPIAGHGRELTHYVLKTEFNRDAFTDDLNLDIIFDANRVDERLVTPIGARYLAALTAIAGDPGARYEHVPLLTAAEREQLATCSGGPVVTRVEAGVADLVAAQAARTPDRVAVSFRDRRLTYDALDRRVTELAARLRELGVGPEIRVGVFMERSLDLPIALLAILKAGGAYVPLDPDHPFDRLKYMARDAQVRAVLTQSGLRDRMPIDGVPVIEADAYVPMTNGAEVAASPPGSGRSIGAGRTHPEQAAYVIYTSGSTGRPKGALNTHRAVVNRLVWTVETYGFAPGDRILQKTPFSFDVSVWELFAPLIAGAELVMAEPGGHERPDYLASVIVERSVTTVHFVPSMLSLFLDAPGARECRSLRQIICSGEALPAASCRRVRDLLDADLHNLYGPTEAAVDVTAWPCAELRNDRVLIGRPIANVAVHILDRHGQPVPPGVPGELFIGGVAPARGYSGAPAHTAERFVPDPFAASPGARLYRTGDLATFVADGAIEYLGRRDAQVKVNGVRVELGEIEAVLRAHPAVRDCAVAVGDRHASSAICAYVVRRADEDVSEPASERALRSWVAARLPRSMMPALWHWLDALPLTPSGKLDRRALPAPKASTPVDALPASILERVAALSDEEVAAWIARAASAEGPR